MMHVVIDIVGQEDFHPKNQEGTLEKNMEIPIKPSGQNECF